MFTREVVSPERVHDDDGRDVTASAFSEAAFDSFHADTFAQVCSFARRLCRDEDEAQDVCQNAYLAVFRYWSSGRLREQPRRLLYRVAQRSAVDVMRARSRRQRLERAVPTPSPGAPWLGAEIREALSGLHPEDASLLVLQAAIGLTREELSALTKQSVPAVRSRLYRARRQLSSLLERQTS